MSTFASAQCRIVGASTGAPDPFECPIQRTGWVRRLLLFVHPIENLAYHHQRLPEAFLASLWLLCLALVDLLLALVERMGPSGGRRWCSLGLRRESPRRTLQQDPAHLLQIALGYPSIAGRLQRPWVDARHLGGTARSRRWTVAQLGSCAKSRLWLGSDIHSN